MRSAPPACRRILVACALVLPLHTGALTAQQGGDRGATRPPRGGGDGRIVGLVLDRITGAPVTGARLRLRRGSCARRPEAERGPEVYAQSDRSGRFAFEPVPVGGYAVEAWMVGYADSCRTVDVAGAESDSVRIRLGPVGYDEHERAGMLRALRAQRARWRAQRPRAYRFRYRRECFCLDGHTGWTTVEVRGDSIRVLDPAGSEATALPAATTVDEVFIALEREIRDPSRRIGRIDYHPRWGYPAWIETDSAPLLTDAWLRIRLADLRPAR